MCTISLSLSIYIYIYDYTCVYIYIYIYVEVHVTTRGHTEGSENLKGCYTILQYTMM